MKNKIINLILMLTIVSYSYGNDQFITGTGQTYGEARNSASKMAYSQGLFIIGQNYHKDKNGNWTVILKVRNK